MNSKVFNMDCMPFLKAYPDKFFKWGVLDPAYGVGANKALAKTGKAVTWQSCPDNEEWDQSTPPPELWEHIFRITENQIVFGANYFLEYLDSTNGMWTWRKENGKSFFADFELIWISCGTVNREITIPPPTMRKEEGDRIHPTQKPLKLYDALFNRYVKPGENIIDPFLGAGNSRIAAYKKGCPFHGYEMSPVYYKRHIEKKWNPFIYDLVNGEQPQELFSENPYYNMDRNIFDEI
jgi:site-specific DNA-methyltransferase (adenine-specific)